MKYFSHKHKLQFLLMLEYDLSYFILHNLLL